MRKLLLFNDQTHCATVLGLTFSKSLATAPSLTASDLSTRDTVAAHTGTSSCSLPNHSSMMCCTFCLPNCGDDRKSCTRSPCLSWMPMKSHLAPMRPANLLKMSFRASTSSSSLTNSQYERINNGHVIQIGYKAALHAPLHHADTRISLDVRNEV